MPWGGQRRKKNEEEERKGEKKEGKKRKEKKKKKNFEEPCKVRDFYRPTGAGTRKLNWAFADW